MKISSLFFICSLLFASNINAQNAIPPSYLVKQDFPDSVANLSLVNFNGEHVTLGEMIKTYAGKKIIVDMWATWCADCIVSMPKLDELRKKLNGEKVAFVYISVDKEEGKWKKGIERFNIQGDHYRIETGWYNSLSNYIDLDWIPRYFVVSEKGRIIFPKAILADDGALQKLLNE